MCDVEIPYPSLFLYPGFLIYLILDLPYTFSCCAPQMHILNLHDWIGKINWILSFNLTHFNTLAYPPPNVVIWHQNWKINTINGRWPWCLLFHYRYPSILTVPEPHCGLPCRISFLHVICNFFKQRSFSELFIFKQQEFSYPLGSGGGSGGEIQWSIFCHPWWFVIR